MKEAFDVAVVGAGLAGLETARRLAASGLRVLLVERRRDLGRGIRTTGIFVRRTLDDFELPGNCLGPSLQRITLWSPRGRALTVEGAASEFRIGRMAALYRRRLAGCLTAGTVWAGGTRVAAVEAGRGGTLLHLAGREGASTVAARFVIGADGVASVVASGLGLDINRSFLVGVEDVWEGALLPGGPGLHAVLDPRIAPGYIAWVAWDGDECHVGVGGVAARFDPLAALAEFTASRPAGLDLRAARRRERRGGRIPINGVLPRIVGPRGLLVGDAAGAVSPLTAGGLDPCLRMSRLAARVTTTYLDSGDADCLAPYAGQLFRARFTSRLWMRRAIGLVRGRAVAEVACALLRLPALIPLARHVLVGRGSFPDVTAAAAVGSDRPATPAR